MTIFFIWLILAGITLILRANNWIDDVIMHGFWFLLIFSVGIVFFFEVSPFFGCLVILASTYNLYRLIQEL